MLIHSEIREIFLKLNLTLELSYFVTVIIIKEIGITL